MDGRLLAALARQSRDLLVVLAPDEGVVYLSPEALRRFTGSDDGDAYRGDGWLATVHPDDHGGLVRAYTACTAEAGAAVPVRFRSTRSGRVRHFEGEYVNCLDDPDLRGVIMTIADVTDRVAAEEALKRRLEIEATMSAISQDFVNRGADALDACVHDALAAIGGLAGGNHASLFMLRPDGTGRITHEWSADGVEPLAPLFDGVALDTLPWSLEVLQRGEPIVVRSVEDLPAEAAPERALIEPSGLAGYAVAPMVRRGELVGVVGLTNAPGAEPFAPEIGNVLAQFSVVVAAAVERRDIEASQRESEERFRRLVQNSGDLIVVVDGGGVLTWVSPAAGRMLGYPPEERVGVNVFDLLHPDDIPLAAQRFGVVLDRPEGSLPQPVPFRIVHRDGHWVDVEVLGTNLLDDPVVQGIVLNVRDMSERLRIEAAMHEAELRFEQVFASAPIGMAIATPASRFVRVNAALCDMLGYTDEELLTRDGFELTHPEDVEKNRELQRQLLEGELREYRLEKRYRHADGHWVWARLNVSAVRDENGNIAYCIGQVEDVTDRKRFEERLAYEATHDALTGLPRRKHVLDHLHLALASARRRPVKVAVLFVDLDRFKRVNDSLGHAAGDELLAIVADRLRTAVRAVDTPGRFGGDEFVVVCPDLAEAQDAVVVAERVRTLLEQPFLVRGGEAFVGASIGIAVAANGDVDAETLLRQADIAAYRAKELGRNRYEIFDEELRATVAHRLGVEAALRHGIDAGEITVAYQPIVSAGERSVQSFEALARWNRPGRGLVGPGEFLGVAEESGLVVQLGRAVLEQACRDAASWAALAGTPPSLAVNISARELGQPEFVDGVAGALTRAGLPAARLCLELTETLLMHDTPQTIATMHELRSLGVGLAIDDFGTGFSSLAYLRRLPVTALKIDRSFVAELDEEEVEKIVASIVDLGHALGMEVVAEGVETARNVERLRALGCDLMQGFWFCRPVPATQARRIVAHGLATPPACFGVDTPE